MNDQIEIKDLDQEIPLQEDWLVFQKDSNRIVYKAPKSDIEGEDAFVYIAYADDDIGTGFTLTFNANKDYIAIKSTNTEIANPVVGDFAGLWKKYKGETGEKGDAATIQVGTVTTVDPEDPATVINSGDEHSAVFNFEIPQGEKGKGIVSIDKTNTVGLIDTYTITYDDGTTSTFDVINGAKGDTGERGLNWINEEYSGAITYNVDDALLYNGSSYRCILESTGNLPTNTTYWSIIAQKGTDGEGSGDMLASVYDPKSVEGDAFNMDNMVEGTNNKLVSSAEKTAWNDKLDDITGESIADLSDVDSIAGITDGKVLKWSTDKFVVADDNDTTYSATDFDIKDLTDSTSLRTTWSGKQDALGFTPEDVDNKRTSFQANPDDSHYISEKLAKDSLDAKLSNPMTTAGDVIYGGSDGTPTRLSKGTAGQVLKMNDGATSPEWGDAGGLRTIEITETSIPTLNVDDYNKFIITMDRNITSMSSGLAGTPTDGQEVEIDIIGKENIGIGTLKYIGSTVVYNDATGSPKLSKPSGVREGDLLIVEFFGYSSYSNTLSGWTEIARETNVNMNAQLFYKVATNSEPSSYYSWGCSGGGKNKYSLSAFRGRFDTSNPIGAYLSSSGFVSGSTITSPTITTTQKNQEVLFIGSYYNTNGGINVASYSNNFMGLYNNHDTTSDSGVFLASIVSPTITEVNCSATLGASSSDTHSFIIVINGNHTIDWGSSYEGQDLPVYSDGITKLKIRYNSSKDKWVLASYYSPNEVKYYSDIISVTSGTTPTKMYHGLGKVPKKVKITGVNASGTYMVTTFGVYNVQTNTEFYIAMGSSVNVNGFTHSVYLRPLVNSDVCRGNISVTNNDLTITWETSDVETMNLLFELE